MYEVGTQVRYHGSLDVFHGETFTVLRHCCGGSRYTLEGIRVLRHVRHASITPAHVDGTGHRAALEQAISAAQPVMITYVAGDGVWTTRTIEPYELTETRAGHPIVRAMDHLRREAHTFRLDRIHALDVLPGSFHLDRPAADMERAALARIRAEIAEVGPGYYLDEMRWSPDHPIPAF